eukprot:9542641-Heterocapsa_arctica.AAC.1
MQKNNMSMREEYEIGQWLDENPEMKADAHKEYDKKLLEGGRPIARKNVTLGNQAFDNLIGAHMAVRTNKSHIDLGTCAKH